MYWATALAREGQDWEPTWWFWEQFAHLKLFAFSVHELVECSREHLPQISALALQKWWMWPYFWHLEQWRTSLLGFGATTAWLLPSNKIRPLSIKRSQYALDDRPIRTRKELLFCRRWRKRKETSGPLSVGLSVRSLSKRSDSCFSLASFLSAPLSNSTPCRLWKRIRAGKIFLGAETDWKSFWVGWLLSMAWALSRAATSRNESTTLDILPYTLKKIFPVL